jgi:hypothetical protein
VFGFSFVRIVKLLQSGVSAHFHRDPALFALWDEQKSVTCSSRREAGRREQRRKNLVSKFLECSILFLNAIENEIFAIPGLGFPMSVVKLEIFGMVENSECI